MTCLVRCQGCRSYKTRDDMWKSGLGYVCDAACIELVRQHARERQAKKTGAARRRDRRTAAGRSYRGPPPSARKATRERDGDRCRWCGTASTIEVHHIVYRSSGGTNDLTNLISLCRTHHAKAHSDKKRFQKVLIETVRLTDEGLFLMVPEVEAAMNEGVT